MLLRTEVTQASDVELLTVILGQRQDSPKRCSSKPGSLFALLFATPQENGELVLRARFGAPTRPIRW